MADFLYPTSKFRRGRVQGNGQISPTITSENIGVCKVEKVENGILYPNENITEGEDASQIDWNNTEYRIRKLTPRECLRLMDVSDEDIEKMEKVNSQTQLYRTAGNSIVVSVLCAVYSQLNIQGIKPWNERSIEEKRALTARGINNGRSMEGH